MLILVLLSLVKPQSSFAQSTPLHVESEVKQANTQLQAVTKWRAQLTEQSLSDPCYDRFLRAQQDYYTWIAKYDPSADYLFRIFYDAGVMIDELILGSDVVTGAFLPNGAKMTLKDIRNYVIWSHGYAKKQPTTLALQNLDMTDNNKWGLSFPKVQALMPAIKKIINNCERRCVNVSVTATKVEGVGIQISVSVPSEAFADLNLKGLELNNFDGKKPIEYDVTDMILTGNDFERTLPSEVSSRHPRFSSIPISEPNRWNYFANQIMKECGDYSFPNADASKVISLQTFVSIFPAPWSKQTVNKLDGHFVAPNIPFGDFTFHRVTDSAGEAHYVSFTSTTPLIYYGLNQDLKVNCRYNGPNAIRCTDGTDVSVDDAGTISISKDGVTANAFAAADLHVEFPSLAGLWTSEAGLSFFAQSDQKQTNGLGIVVDSKSVNYYASFFDLTGQYRPGFLYNNKGDKGMLIPNNDPENLTLTQYSYNAGSNNQLQKVVFSPNAVAKFIPGKYVNPHNSGDAFVIVLNPANHTWTASINGCNPFQCSFDNGELSCTNGGQCSDLNLKWLDSDTIQNYYKSDPSLDGAYSRKFVRDHPSASK